MHTGKYCFTKKALMTQKGDPYIQCSVLYLEYDQYVEFYNSVVY